MKHLPSSVLASLFALGLTASAVPALASPSSAQPQCGGDKKGDTKDDKKEDTKDGKSGDTKPKTPAFSL